MTTKWTWPPIGDKGRPTSTITSAPATPIVESPLMPPKLRHRNTTALVATRLSHLAAALLLTASVAHAQRDVVYEASIQDLQTAMTQGRTTSVALVNAYLARIAAYDH